MENAEDARLKGYDKMNDIPANLIYNPNELDKWLDETSVPLSDDDMKAMSAYFDSENFQHAESTLCDLTSIDKQKNEI